MKKMKNVTWMLLLGLFIGFVSCSDDDKDDGDPLTGLEVSVEKLTATFSGDTIDVTVSSSLAWKAESSAKDWCVITPQEDKLSIVIMEHEGKDTREATITVTAGTESKTITVTQTGVSGEVSADVSYVSLHGSGFPIKVQVEASGEDWTVTSSEEWCRVEKDGNMIIVQATRADGDRDAVVTLEMATGAKFDIDVEQFGGGCEPGDFFEYNGSSIGVVIGSTENNDLYIIYADEKEVLFCPYGENYPMALRSDTVSFDGQKAIALMKQLNEEIESKPYGLATYCEEVEETTGIEGWYIAGSDEMVWSYIRTNYAVINASLKALGTGMDPAIFKMYWTSTVHYETGKNGSTGVLCMQWGSESEIGWSQRQYPYYTNFARCVLKYTCLE